MLHRIPHTFEAILRDRICLKKDEVWQGSVSRRDGADVQRADDTVDVYKTCYLQIVPYLNLLWVRMSQY